MNNKNYYIYILSNKKNGTLYIGISNSIYKRVLKHKEKINPDSFTAKYNLDRLVYYERYDSPKQAIAREKNLKAWKREWKIALIEKDNPSWRDLFKDME